MSTEELRAAANRWQEGNYSYSALDCDTYSDSEVADMRLLARAYLAEHPADDAEPVTAEWLRSVGFCREMQPASSNNLTIRHGSAIVTRWMNSDNVPRWSVRMYADETPDWVPPCIQPKTRGDVRRLCKALGIELKEATHAQ